MLGIKIKRNELNMTQSALAEIIGVDIMTVSRWERGKQEPSIETLKKLSTLFNCSIDYLVNPTTPLPRVKSEQGSERTAV